MQGRSHLPPPQDCNCHGQLWASGAVPAGACPLLLQLRGCLLLMRIDLVDDRPPPLQVNSQIKLICPLTLRMVDVPGKECGPPSHPCPLPHPTLQILEVPLRFPVQQVTFIVALSVSLSLTCATAAPLWSSSCLTSHLKQGATARCSPLRAHFLRSCASPRTQFPYSLWNLRRRSDATFSLLPAFPCPSSTPPSPACPHKNFPPTPSSSCPSLTVPFRSRRNRPMQALSPTPPPLSSQTNPHEPAALPVINCE